MRARPWIAAALTLGLIGPLEAQSATFTFSFSNVTGEVDGTVEGIFELPDGDGNNLAATSFLITSYPSALGYGDAPIDALLRDNENEFRVVGGEIRRAEFASLLTPSSSPFQLDTRNAIGGTFMALFGDNIPTSGVLDSVNTPTLTFAAVEAVPLPPGLALLLTGLGTLAFRSCRRRKPI
ncbi:MAG: PEP-CTERM sorting domain-containing protein [Pseudomonadota bacterium]